MRAAVYLLDGLLKIFEMPIIFSPIYLGGGGRKRFFLISFFNIEIYEMPRPRGSRNITKKTYTPNRKTYSKYKSRLTKQR